MVREAYGANRDLCRALLGVLDISLTATCDHRSKEVECITWRADEGPS